MEITVLYGQDVFYLANVTYGIDNVFKLLSENGIESIDFDFDANPQQKINYDSSFKIKISPQLQGKKTIVVNEVQYINSYDGQNIFDLITQAYFDIGLSYKFIQDNNIANINEGVKPSQSFNFNTSYIPDAGIYSSFLKSRKIISTGEFEQTSAPSNLSYILRQDGGYLLRQDGGKFLRH